MGAILKLFAAGSGGWILYAVIAGAIFAGGAWSGHKAQSLIDAPRLARAEAALAKEQSDYAEYRSSTVAAIAQQERVTAAAERLAAQNARANAVAVARLQAQLATETATRARMSAQLTEALRHALSTDDRDLGPALLAYVSGVRAQQSAGDHPAAGARDSRP